MKKFFFDIETAAVPWSELDEDTRGHWRVLAATRYADELELFDIETVWDEKAALHAEFGHVVCVAAAIDDGDVKVLVGKEKEILERLFDGLNRRRFAMVAHNIEFDVPYLCRRMVVHGIKVPNPLLDSQAKPWERINEDTMETWAFGQWKYKVKLDLLANTLGVPSPKDSMDGSDVTKFWRDGLIDEIGAYCARDVECLRSVYRRIEECLMP